MIVPPPPPVKRRRVSQKESACESYIGYTSGTVGGAESFAHRKLTHRNESHRLLGMSKRLQVLLEDKELRQIQKSARESRMTVAEWVRQALRAARAGVAAGDSSTKLEAVRRASKHGFPTADVDQMLGEIEQGYVKS